METLLGGLAAGTIAGAINSIAGGGTMISFPLLIFLGLTPLVANASNTVGIWPGAIGSAWGFRRELQALPRRYFWLLCPVTLGGAIGAWILRSTPAEHFERIIPYLLGAATLLFIAQPWIRRLVEPSATTTDQPNGSVTAALLSTVLLTLVAIYGGYFGAGMSILMLSLLGLVGLSDMLQMTATTSLLSLGINGAAGLIFIAGGMVRWDIALPMMVGSILGGYLAAGWARRLGRVAVRRFVLLMGVVMTLALFWRAS